MCITESSVILGDGSQLFGDTLDALFCNLRYEVSNIIHYSIVCNSIFIVCNSSHAL